MTPSEQRLGLRSLLLALLALPLAAACASASPSSSLPLPPEDPQPAASFSVEFVPEGSDVYPPTDAKDVVRFKNLLHWPGQPDEVRGDVQPTRPYVRVGNLKFGQSWYHSSNIKELVNTHVPRVGGDAVLVYHAYQSGIAQVHRDSGNPETVWFMSIVLEVIRYTDR